MFTDHQKYEMLRRDEEEKGEGEGEGEEEKEGGLVSPHPSSLLRDNVGICPPWHKDHVVSTNLYL